MKKILLFLTAVFSIGLLVNCDDDPVVGQSIAGTWKPVKMVETVVDSTGSQSETFYYSDCQQLSRWVFNKDNTGSVLEQDDTYTSCHVKFQSNLNYEYNDKTGEITLTYITFQDQGVVLDLTDSTMNLKIENVDLVNDVYISETYTLVKTN
ncbi:lipocalin family protein [Chryseobacterium sp. MFBS3-17]|uniref:lipocalin family protein n=1 Tax=Chryseobacterium sp. MFBS3-17 TaxID=2886689 RepID=UPI001D0E42C7|nr:lipocalin family protein [Chryseobacterium sp. MFBS3-17]MCC2589708.1 lipocalin family protein [Chryseobacterium sp. MFBS3-17]